MCADEADVDQQEIKGVAVISYNVLQEVPWKLEIKCKAGMYLLVNLVLPFFLNGQHLLSVTKAFCQSSITFLKVSCYLGQN